MVIVQNRLAAEDCFSARWRILLALILFGMMVLIGRAVYLQVWQTNFLQQQGTMRHVVRLPVPANRGRILDRNGELLAVSTPVKSIWVNPKELFKNGVRPERFEALAEALGIPVRELEARVAGNGGRGFVYLRRRMDPEQADRAISLGLPGVYAEREFRRFYPTGEVTAHLLGMNGIDDRGQEGLELAYDQTLRGRDGLKRIVRDGKRRIIEDMEDIRLPVPGQDLVLSIDERLQYLAYRELQAAFLQHKARAASLVLLDAQTGEVLAMVNQPSFNPNSRTRLKGGVTRNRALTDLFEPGSTMKPFAVACALELGLTRPGAMITNGASTMYVGNNIVRDGHHYGALDVGRVLQKSSNVGVTKIALLVPPRKFWAFYNNLGFGQPLDTHFPGEARGRLPHYRVWNPFKQATLSFGYGVSTSVLQLGRAYLALANDGAIPMVSIEKLKEPPKSLRIMSAQTAATVRGMLEKVVSPEGTALKAAVPGFRVAGKTGTAKKAGAHGYSNSQYVALFAGMAPATRPRLVMVVMVDEPSAGQYYGGAVAAPIFSRVMEGALRILNIAPDAPIAPLMASRQDERV